MIALFDVQIMCSDIQIMPKRKENRLLSRGKLIKWIYKETETEIALTEKQKKKENLITNTLCLQTTKLKPYVMLGPFQT